jgi:photosystem II stability/assembly factor-like uncharacterized protein
MDPTKATRLTNRQRRAVGLITIALMALAVFSAAYLWKVGPSSTGSLKVGTVSSPDVMSIEPSFAVTYDFVSPSIGWALLVGPQPQFWVYRTTDGAKHWQKQFSDISLPGPMGMRFFDSNHGLVWVLLQLPAAYATDDGGAHWHAVQVPDGSLNLTFADPLHGWALTSAGASESSLRFYMTSDGGHSWDQRSWPSSAAVPGKGGSVDQFDFRPDGEGWLSALAPHPTVLHTVNGGATWEADVIAPAEAMIASTPGPGVPLILTRAVLLPKEGLLAVVQGLAGTYFAFRSFDGDVTWEQIPQPPGSAQFSDLLFLDSTHWWAWRYGIVSESADAGLTWSSQRVRSLLPDWDYLPHVIDSKHAWALLVSTSRHGTGLAMTMDGGVNWRTVNVPNPN